MKTSPYLDRPLRTLAQAMADQRADSLARTAPLRIAAQARARAATEFEDAQRYARYLRDLGTDRAAQWRHVPAR